MQAGCDVNAVDHCGLRPVHYAVQLAPIGILCKLLHCNVDPNALTVAGNKRSAEHDKLSQWGRGDLSPLMLAASQGRDDAVRVLLDGGAKANLTNSRRETALHYAAATPGCMEECIIALVGQHPNSETELADFLNSQVLRTAVCNCVCIYFCVFIFCISMI